VVLSGLPNALVGTPDQIVERFAELRAFIFGEELDQRAGEGIRYVTSGVLMGRAQAQVG